MVLVGESHIGSMIPWTGCKIWKCRTMSFYGWELIVSSNFQIFRDPHIGFFFEILTAFIYFPLVVFIWFYPELVKGLLLLLSEYPSAHLHINRMIVLKGIFLYCIVLRSTTNGEDIAWTPHIGKNHLSNFAPIFLCALLKFFLV